MIIAGVIEVLLNHFAHGMDPLSSVMAPRFYHQVFIEAHAAIFLFFFSFHYQALTCPIVCSFASYLVRFA